MIKQIQLRGISRTPSDRLSEDGGLSESLNMFMDTAENAPAFVPEDVTKDLKLPADLQAERIFIHKTANYENYIVVQLGKVQAYTPDIVDDEPLLLLDLTDGEEVLDINSVGNTLILATSANLYYILYQNRTYTFLGHKAPFPIIDFTREEVSDLGEIKVEVGTEATGVWFIEDNNLHSYLPTEEEWNEDSKGGKDHTGRFKTFLDNVWEEINDKLKVDATQQGYLTSPIVIRYDFDLYGSSISSVPIVIPATLSPSINLSTYKAIRMNAGVRSYTSRETATITADRIQKYKIKAKLSGDWDFDAWKDLISSVRIYISFPMGWDILENSTEMTSREESYDSSDVSGSTIKNETFTSDATIVFRANPDFRETVLRNTAETFLIKEIPLLNDTKTDISEDFKKLVEGEILDIRKYIDPSASDYVQLASDEGMLVESDMKHYTTASKSLDVFNNRVILVQPSQLIDYEFNRLNAYDITAGLPYNNNVTTYEVTYLLRGHTEDKVVKETFVYYQNAEKTERIYGFQIFPDNRAYKMLIKITSQDGDVTTVTYQEYDMLPHPYLDCAYYYGGLSRQLNSLGTIRGEFNYPVNALDDTDNKIFISEINKPFEFPDASKYTFQSKVLSVAIATTALSQGQFGQFPLYVFTEDGIWAMETAADGSFVTSKPLSREVCINPDAICPIDNAVVFVTNKAVMMISGSQVANISPFMNGRHYTPNDSAKNLIRKEEGFTDLVPAIADDDPFMRFMSDAKTAYDYTGQRLIFISPSNTGFQYVYKIDTQTWHKVAFDGFDLDFPLNSYPECLVQGRKNEKRFLWYVDRLRDEVITANIADVIRTRIPSITNEEVQAWLDKKAPIDVTAYVNDDFRFWAWDEFYFLNIETTIVESEKITKIFSLSTVLDASREQETAKGILITRPFDLGMPDVFKSITKIKIRGDYDKDNVKFILQGSDNGRDFYTLTSLRGKSWKMFRIFILADLEPTERISWIDIDFEPRYQNKLR